MRLPRKLLAALLLSALPAQLAQARALLMACVDVASPTAEMDVRLAQAAALTQGYGLHVEHFDSAGRNDDEFSASNFGKLAAGFCPLILGFPVDARTPLLPDGVQATRPYAQTGFVLVAREPPPALDALRPGLRVAVVMGTQPAVMLIDHPQLVAATFRQDDLALAALQAGKVSAALIWQPSLARYQEHHPKARPLFMRPLDAAHARWNLVALFAPEAQAAASVFEQGIAKLQDQGRLAGLLSRFASEPVAPAVDARLQRGPERLPPRGRLLPVASAAKPATKVPALYTSEQATAGLIVYARHCALCHGLDMAGRVGPALKGARFANAQTNFVIADIFIVVSQQMPAGGADRLQNDEYAAIMAYLLQQNGYPAGKQALSYEAATTSEVPLRYRGP